MAARHAGILAHAESYLRILMQKYRYAVIQPVLEECFFGNTLGGIVGVSQWDRSYNYGLYIFEALLRLLMEFYEKLGFTSFIRLKEHVINSIQLLHVEKLSEDDIKKFCEQRQRSYTILEEALPLLNDELNTHAKEDEVFTFFKNVLDDLMVYMMLYISIRSGDWSLRLTSLKMMAERFVTSGATLYQWIVLRHLADLVSIFPSHPLDFFEKGGWVSALKDVKWYP